MGLFYHILYYSKVHDYRKNVSKSFYRHSKFHVEYNVYFETLLQQGVSEQVFYGELVNNNNNIHNNNNNNNNKKIIIFIFRG